MSASERLVPLEEQLAALRPRPADPELEFHAITLTADEAGQIIVGHCSEWIGFADDAHRVEIRASRVVDADYGELWDAAGQAYIHVLDGEALALFWMCGGHALVERSIAEQAFAHSLGTRPAYFQGRYGFVGETLLDETALRRAPTPKLRMTILQRDRARCRICGRRPDDDVDLILNVHHIRPWARGGVTDPDNLITLCHTCHNGLDPHFDPGLFDYTVPRDPEAQSSAFERSVARYREAIRSLYLSASEGTAPRADRSSSAGRVRPRKACRLGPTHR